MRAGRLWVWIWIEGGKLLDSIAMDWNCSNKTSLFFGPKQLHKLLFCIGYHTSMDASRSVVSINSDLYRLPSSLGKVPPYSYNR